MTKGILASSICAFSLLVFGSAQADVGDDGWTPGDHWVMDAGINGGGDTLATINWSDDTTSGIYAGNGLFGDFGMQRNFADTDWSLKATLGFDYNFVSGSNGRITFNRYPLDLLAIYSSGDSHIGFGVTEHFEPRLKLDGFGPNEDFNNATGVMVQYQYWLFGIRATSIRYEISSGCSANCRRNGSSIGVFFNYPF